MSKKGHCTACRPGKPAIIAALRAKGLSYAAIGEKVGLRGGVIGNHLNAGHTPPALADVIAEREKLAAETHVQALERIAREQRERAAKLDARNDPGGASKIGAREADIHVALGGGAVARREDVHKVHVSFAFLRPRPALDVERLEDALTAPALEVPLAATPATLDAAPDASEPEIAALGAPESDESPEARFVREGFEKRAREDALEDALKAGRIERERDLGPRRWTF